MQKFTNYNPDQVILTFAGLQIQGFADGSFVKVKPLSPGFTSKAGADRLVSRSRQNDPRVQITITLMKGSASNTALSTIHEADLDAPNGSGVAPFSLTDLNGDSSLQATYAWIEQAPEDDYSKEEGECEWVLTAIKELAVNGGR